VYEKYNAIKPAIAEMLKTISMSFLFDEVIFKLFNEIENKIPRIKDLLNNINIDLFTDKFSSYLIMVTLNLNDDGNTIRI